jgi:hypothetical protein
MLKGLREYLTLWCYPPTQRTQEVYVLSKSSLMVNILLEFMWEVIKRQGVSINQYQLIYGLLHIPRHSFVVWLCILNELTTSHVQMRGKFAQIDSYTMIYII